MSEEENNKFIDNIPIKDIKGVSTGLFTGLLYAIKIEGNYFLEYQKSNYFNNEKEETLHYSSKKSFFAISLEAPEKAEITQEIRPNYLLYSFDKKAFLALGGEKTSHFKLSSSKEKSNHYALLHVEKNHFISVNKDVDFFFQLEYQITSVVYNFNYPTMLQTLSQIAEKNKSEFFIQYSNEGDSTVNINLPFEFNGNLLYSWIYHKSPETEFLKNIQTIIIANFFTCNADSQQEISFNSKNIIGDSPFEYFIENNDGCSTITKFAVPAREQMCCKIVWSYLNHFFIFEAFAKFDLKAYRMKKNDDKIEVIYCKIDKNAAISILESQGASVFSNEKDEIVMVVKGELHIKGNLPAKQTITETSKDKKKQ